MRIPIYQIDAFAEAPFRGNPAAVCPLESWLPDSVLQSIAEENNLSETAFYVREGNGFRLRWFTPNQEVDLCGHATLATAYVIFRRAPELKQITFQSRSGPLHVSCKDDLITLDFPVLGYEESSIPERLVRALGRTPSEYYRGMDHIAVFRSQKEIEEISPDFGVMKSLDLRGVIVTAPGETKDFVSRFFAPNCGIDEDPVTGSAHCMLAPYWGEKLGKSTMSAVQLSKREGMLECRLVQDRVFISGRAVAYLEGAIEVPDRLLCG
jgi:PhzF family phenazine biosynthesis protein